MRPSLFSTCNNSECICPNSKNGVGADALKSAAKAGRATAAYGVRAGVMVGVGIALGAWSSLELPTGR